LTAMGVVDKSFARHVRMSAGAAFILGPSDHDAAIVAIRGDAAGGVAID